MKRIKAAEKEKKLEQKTEGEEEEKVEPTDDAAEEMDAHFVERIREKDVALVIKIIFFYLI